MFLDLPINWVLVIFATIVNFAIGALWYGPVFGKTWMRLMEFTPNSMKNMPLTPMKAMAVGFILTFISTYILANFAILWVLYGVWGALKLAFMIWLGFMVPIIAGGYLWEGKSIKLFAFNALYYLVSISVSSIIIVLFGKVL